MTYVDYNRKYDEDWNLYPVFAQDMSTEGAFKRFMPMPMPKEVFDYALMGLPKILPLTGERITPEGLCDADGNITSDISIADYLTSAITELEMDLGCNLSEVVHFHTEDWIEGMDNNNYYPKGLNLNGLLQLVCENTKKHGIRLYWNDDLDFRYIKNDVPWLDLYDWADNRRFFFFDTKEEMEKYFYQIKEHDEIFGISCNDLGELLDQSN